MKTKVDYLDVLSLTYLSALTMINSFELSTIWMIRGPHRVGVVLFIVAPEMGVRNWLTKWIKEVYRPRLTMLVSKMLSGLKFKKIGCQEKLQLSLQLSRLAWELTKAL